MNSLTVLLSWQPVSGATGYSVLRGGAELAHLSSSDLSFSDHAVKPFTAYGYQVRVEGVTITYGARGGFPLLSPVVQVQVPPPAPPAGFTGTLLGSQIRLSWSARPEASAYQIKKGTQTFRVAAGTPLTLLDAVAGSADLQYTIQSVVKAYDGSETTGYPSAPLTMRLRPFNMAVVGDSVMWGQGLKDANKFSTRLIPFLVGALGGRAIRPLDFAHSGAIIGSYADDRDKPSDATTVGGEVPESYPSVLHQAMSLVRNQMARPEDLDLIVMDGCANDVGLLSILEPWTNDSQISTSVSNACGLLVEQALELMHGTYPNAKIIVTGYFPIVSAQSDLSAVAGLLIALGGPVGVAGTIDFHDKVIDHSTVFYATSSASLQSAVQTADSRGGGRFAKLVLPTFDASSSYAAPNTFLWLMPLPPTLPTQYDEVFLPRQGACLSMGFSMPQTCRTASGGHPNVLGALAYANAAITALSEFVPQWRMQFSTVQSIP